ncbi:MAG: hypothetical protein Q7Q73_09810 [Verrucomicrobiota bacterium JB024]|nr:hypothetical protein [Verrucomicrobiota bacterium JB024]
MPISKPIALILSSLLFLLCADLSAQKVDWDKAPLNPIGVKYKAEHFNLKGPVFSADKKVFDEQGLLIKDIVYVSYENGLPTGKGDVIWETDAEGNITRETFPSGRVSNYIYRDGLLVEESYTYDKQKGTKRYSYDESGRLARLELENNGQTETTTYAYTADGDSVNVTENFQRENGTVKRSVKTYKGGYLTASRTEGEPIELNVEYTFDTYGNPVEWVYAQNNGVRDDFVARYQYYPELRQANQLTYGSVYDDKLYPSLIFRNGQIAEDVSYAKRSDESGYVIYDDFSNSYYLAEIDPDRKPGDRIEARLIAENFDTIAFFKDYKIQPFYKGETIFDNSKNTNSVTLNGDIITYSSHQRLKRHTSLFFDLEPNQLVLKGHLLAQTRRYFASHMFYSVSDEGELELFLNAKRIPDVSQMRMGKMGENDLVLYVNDKPCYVLYGALAEPSPGVYMARYYEKDRDSVEPLPDDFVLTFSHTKAKVESEGEAVPGYSEQDVAALYTFTPEDISSRVRPYVNRTAAPLNPVTSVGGVYDLNLDGDIAYAFYDGGSYYFDEDGQRINPKQDVFTDEETARREKATYWLFDDANKLLLHRGFYPAGWDSIYKYNPDGTLRATYIIDDGQVTGCYTYEYDKDRRLVKKVLQTGKETTTETYSYREEDGQLHITSKETGPDGEIARSYVYGNGREVKFTQSGSNPVNKTYQYMNDDSGNPYVRLDQDGVETELRYYYHTDTWQLDRWHWINEKVFGQYNPALYVDDRRVGTLYGSYTEETPFAHGVFYEPIGQNYLIAENALLPATRKDPDARGKMQLKVSAPAMLYLTATGQFRFYVYGRLEDDLKQFRLGQNLVLYNNRNGHTYLIQDFDTGAERFFPVEDLGSDVATWFRASKESDFIFIENGEVPTGLGNGGFYANGDLLVKKDGQPWGILEAADIKGSTDKVYIMTHYSGRGLPGETPPPSKTPTVTIQKYGFGVPITLEREAGKYRFYQKGQPIFEPKAFVVGDSGNAFAFYDTTSYHLFKQAKGLPSGQTLLEEKMIIDPLLVENNGSQTRVWWEGELVPESEYKLFPCDNGSRFLYLSKIKKYYELKGWSSYLNYQVGSGVGSPNVLIKNSDGTLDVITRGVAEPREEISGYMQGDEYQIYLGSDPTYVIRDLDSTDELAPGIYPLYDFSY